MRIRGHSWDVSIETTMALPQGPAGPRPVLAGRTADLSRALLHVRWGSPERGSYGRIPKAFNHQIVQLWIIGRVPPVWETSHVYTYLYTYYTIHIYILYDYIYMIIYE